MNTHNRIVCSISVSCIAASIALALSAHTPAAAIDTAIKTTDSEDRDDRDDYYVRNRSLLTDHEIELDYSRNKAQFRELVDMFRDDKALLQLQRPRGFIGTNNPPTEPSPEFLQSAKISNERFWKYLYLMDATGCLQISCQPQWIAPSDEDKAQVAVMMSISKKRNLAKTIVFGNPGLRLQPANADCGSKTLSTKAIEPHVFLNTVELDHTSLTIDDSDSSRVYTELGERIPHPLKPEPNWLTKGCSAARLLCAISHGYMASATLSARGFPSASFVKDPQFWNPRSFLLQSGAFDLNDKYPCSEPRILMLLDWFGTDADHWIHYPAYQSMVHQFLLLQPWQTIMDTIETKPLSHIQTEGAARFIAMTNNPRLNVMLSSDTKRLILDHVKSSGDGEKLESLTRALANSGTPRRVVIHQPRKASPYGAWHVESEQHEPLLINSTKLERWLKAAPPSISTEDLIDPDSDTKTIFGDRGLFNPAALAGFKSTFSPNKTNQINEGLNRDYPLAKPRIHALLSWFGSGTGPWTNFPVYEKLPERWLVLQPIDDIMDVIEHSNLTQSELEGAARFLATTQKPYIVRPLAPAAQAKLRRYLTSHSAESKLECFDLKTTEPAQTKK